MGKKWLVGIDGGGTKTSAYAAEIDGTVLAHAQETAANYHVVGVEEFKRVVIALLTQLMDETGLGMNDLQVISFGLAGVDRPDDAKTVRGALAEIGITCEVLLNHDAAIALAAGAGKKQGVVVIAGTGSIAYGVNRQGAECRAGGFGHLIGDEGSGYAIAAAGIRKALMAEEGRCRPTTLMQYLLAAAGLASRNDLIRFVYQNSADKAEIASLAEAVTACAASGDAVAGEILTGAGYDLAGLIQSVLQRCFAGEQQVKVIACGSVLTKVQEIQDVVREELGSRAELIPLTCDAALGAVNIAVDSLASRGVVQ